MNGTASTAKLSRLQRAILADVLALYLHFEEHGNDFAKHLVRRDGVRLACLRGYGTGKAPAERAAHSRALRRLEQRGLLVRVNVTTGLTTGPEKGYKRGRPDQPHTRTDHVMLTEQGRATATNG